MNTTFDSNTAFIVTGGIFLLVALLNFLRLMILVSKGITTEAVIKELIEVRNSKGPRVFFPMLEFRTEKEEVITVKSYIGQGKGQQQIGDKVKLLYNPDKPEQFLINSGIDKYWKIIGAVIAGIVFIAVGLLHLI